MGKSAFWKSDWFLALIVTLGFLFAANSDLLQSLERKAYDLGVEATSRTPSDQVAVIAIDDQSIANIGRWPWPRDVHAKMADILAGAKAKVVGSTVFFFEPQIDPGLTYINKLTQLVDAPALKALPEPAAQDITQISAVLTEAGQKLNTDKVLADSLAKASNTLLAMTFALGEPRGNPDKALPEYISKSAVTVDGRVTDDTSPLRTESVQVPIETIGKSALATGYLNFFTDLDGSIRTEPLVLAHYGQYFPSLSLMLVARSLNLDNKEIHVKPGEGVSLGKLHIRTDPNLLMYTYYYKDRGGRPAIPPDSFYDVYTGKIPAQKYAGKIVLIGSTAAGEGSTQVTPIGVLAPVMMLAHAVSSIVKEDFFVTPGWGFWAEKAVLLLVALYLILLLPRLNAGKGATITAVLFIALLATHFGLMTTQGIWIQLMVPATLLLVGHLLLTTKHFLVTEKGKTRSDADSAESNRMLGLAFQGQGQLDIAFDKFRKLPLDNTVMDILYNLALDFERKRQFNKASSVFQYMADYNPKFRDLEQRLTRSRAMEETVILGGSGGRSNSSTMLLENGTVEKPMLGRYQVEKELGKGAMGVVYLGRDPKISRVVAIKTMALSQEFDADELDDVKARFFREAETAGRLNHPNIVTIFDAGEEHDLAYIAMEFLKGKDLVQHSKPGQLLPLAKVLSITARVAHALNYAHLENVVHRDIKPANIMYEPDSDSVKVTDFGIARITDSSRTKTGMVLGTPSYMSPEQLAGKKIDGRSDLFSLGVMLYQMSSGQLPFQGDSMAQLMFRISNEAPVDILTINPALPDCVVAIINKALTKEPELRYQTGDELAKALEQCAASLSAGSIDIGV